MTHVSDSLPDSAALPIGSELLESQDRIMRLFPLPHVLEVQFGCVPPRSLHSWLRRDEGRLILDIFMRRRAAASRLL